MKKVILSFIVFFAFAHYLQAQTFNGTIHFSIEMTGENAEQMAPFMPTGYVYYFSGNDLLFKMEGGMTAAILGDVLNIGNKTYMINHNETTAYILPMEKKIPLTDSPNKVTKTSEETSILGYTCTKYKIVNQTEDGDVTQYMWVSKDLKPSLNKSKITSGVPFVEAIEGFPLKVITEVMGMTMVMTATKIDKTEPNKELFIIPSNYEIKAFDPSSFGLFDE